MLRSADDGDSRGNVDSSYSVSSDEYTLITYRVVSGPDSPMRCRFLTMGCYKIGPVAGVECSGECGRRTQTTAAAAGIRRLLTGYRRAASVWPGVAGVPNSS